MKESCLSFLTACLIFCGAFFLCMMFVWTERDLNTQSFGQSRFEVAEKIKQCEADLARNQRCKVVVLVFCKPDPLKVDDRSSMRSQI